MTGFPTYTCDCGKDQAEDLKSLRFKEYIPINMVHYFLELIKSKNLMEDMFGIGMEDLK